MRDTTIATGDPNISIPTAPNEALAQASMQNHNFLIDTIIAKLILDEDFRAEAKDLLQDPNGPRLLEQAHVTERYSRVLDRLVEKTLSNLIDPENAHLLESRDEAQRFRTRHYAQWEHPLRLAEVFLAVSVDLGADINNAQRPIAAQCNDAKFEAMIRSHSRACRIGQEALCLASNGYGGGALARWRTLHEIAVVCLFLQRNDQELSRRYLLYDLVDSHKSASAHDAYADRFNCSRPTREELDRLDLLRESLKSTYGADFVRTYGWASGYVSGKPDFDRIQAAVGLEHCLPRYKLASQEIHANAKPLYWTLAAGLQDKHLLVGPSHEGLAEAVHPIMLSINMVSGLLVNDYPGGSRLLVLKVLDALAEQVGAALLAAHNCVEGTS